MLAILFFLPAISAQEKRDSVIVSLITCWPGPEIYELCGHEALRVQDGKNDLVYNYGTFDFTAPNFVYRFLKGETDYMLSRYPFAWFMPEYVETGRKVVEQRLNLTQAEARKLAALLQKQALPENATYRYNYVLDNCATRIVDDIDRCAGETVVWPDSVKYGSFRREMRQYHRDYPWYQFGIDLCLGSGVDRTITRRETMFAPVVLQQLVADAVIPTSHGAPGRPLVASTQTLVEGSPDALSQPTPWILTPMAAMLALLIITCAVTYHDIRGRHQSRWFDAILFGAYGVLGCIIAFLIFISVHEATSPNWLFLWLNPLCLLVPILIWTAPARRILKIYLTAAVIATVALGLLYIAGVQSLNPAFVPMMLAGIIRSLFIILPREKSKTT